MKFLFIISILFPLVFPLISLGVAPPLEVVHWWTTGAEAKSMQAFQQAFEKRGFKWLDSPIAGSGSAMTVLKTRIIAGNPPPVAQLKGPRLKEFAEEDLLLSLDQLAKKQNWEKIFPPAIRKLVQYQGHYFGVPVNVHRGNWMWVNPTVFKKAGAKIPDSWESFLVEAEKIQKAGFIPLALGGEKWQEAVLFESIVLSLGKDFYRKAFIEKDKKAFSDPLMTKAFELFRKVKVYTDRNTPGRSWDVTLNLVIQGEAGLQIMGDWAKSEFQAQKKIYGKDYLCLPSPGTEGTFTFVVDSFGLLKGKSADTKAQYTFAEILVEPSQQLAFNLLKGSIPSRIDLTGEKFDSCSQKSMEDFKQANREDKLLPSFANDMALDPYTTGSTYDLISQYFHSHFPPQEAALRLGEVVRESL